MRSGANRSEPSGSWPAKGATPPAWHTPPAPTSPAATRAGAHDLHGNLCDLLDGIEYLKLSDGGGTPDPVPDWWDGPIPESAWTVQQSDPTPEHRTRYLACKVHTAIGQLIGNSPGGSLWDRCVRSIEIPPEYVGLFQAARDGLRNLQGILSPSQNDWMLRYEVVPDPRHLADPLPGTWDGPAGESEEEREAQKAAYRAAFAWAKSLNTDATLESKHRRAIARLKALRAKREKDNKAAAEAASKAGLVTPDVLAEEKHLREKWGRQIMRWNLRHADVLRLVEYLAGRAAQQPTRSKASEPSADPTGDTENDWRDVQGQLLAKRERGEPYTSLRALAAELGCSDRTIRKAIDRSDILKGWRARTAKPKAAPKATGLSKAVIDNTRQTTEPSPDDVLNDDDVEVAMARLIDQANDEERARLNAMDDNERRAMAVTYLSQCLDDEPSPLKSDKPDERLRRVKHYKRA